MHEIVRHPLAASFQGAVARHARMARTLSEWESAAAGARWEHVRARLARLPEPWRDFVPQPLGSERAEQSVLALLYAAMALEARCSEAAEELLPEKELRAFSFCDGKYKLGSGWTSKPTWRWKLLFDRIGLTLDLSDALLADTVRLFEDRNALVHHSPRQSATTIVHAPPREVNGMIELWNANRPPSNVNYSRLPELLHAASATRAERVMNELLTRFHGAHVAWEAAKHPSASVPTQREP